MPKPISKYTREWNVEYERPQLSGGNVLWAVQPSVRTNVHRISVRTSIEPSEVERVLQNNGFHAFHMRAVQNPPLCDYTLTMFTFVNDWTTAALSAWASAHGWIEFTIKLMLRKTRPASTHECGKIRKKCYKSLHTIKSTNALTLSLQFFLHTIFHKSDMLRSIVNIFKDLMDIIRT